MLMNSMSSGGCQYELLKLGKREGAESTFFFMKLVSICLDQNSHKRSRFVVGVREMDVRQGSGDHPVSGRPTGYQGRHLQKGVKMGKQFLLLLRN